MQKKYLESKKWIVTNLYGSMSNKVGDNLNGSMSNNVGDNLNQ